MATGIRSLGEHAFLKSSLTYRKPEADVAIFYGLAGRLSAVLRDYRREGLKAVYIDLGYWKRKDAGRFAGFHKLAVNDRHPTAYFQRIKHSPDRARALGIKVKPWRRDSPQNHVLVAGMGPKGARAEGYGPNEWEKMAAELVRSHTGRRLVYRPKPNWEHATPVPGCSMRKGTELEADLRGCHALVTHHSNAAVEAILAGVPAFSVEGVGVTMGLSDFSLIERPAMPEGRDQWAADLAYCQWSVEEMEAGLAYRYLKDEGLIP